MFRINRPGDNFETLLGANATFDGHLKCKGGVRIEGAFTGSIETEGNIIVGKAAKLGANLSGRNILVSGKITGNVRSEGQLAILAGGQVVGDVDVGSILIEEGGVLSGRCNDRSAAKCSCGNSVREERGKYAVPSQISEVGLIPCRFSSPVRPSRNKFHHRRRHGRHIQRDPERGDRARERGVGSPLRD